MNKPLHIAITLGAFGAGIALGYYICKKQIVEQYQQDTAEVKEFYANKIEELGVMPNNFEPSDTLPEYPSPQSYHQPASPESLNTDAADTEYNKKVLRYSGTLRSDGSKGKPMTKYNKPPLGVLLDAEDSGDKEFDEEDDDPDEMDAQYEAELEKRAEEYATRKYENRINGRPYVIDFNEYENGPEEYEKITLYYYNKDRVLCEEDDSEVEDEEEAIGFDYEDILDMQTTAWVRNDILYQLFEIHRIDESYKLTVLGARETPKERELRLLGRLENSNRTQ